MMVISALHLRNGKDKEPAGSSLSLAIKWELVRAQCLDCQCWSAVKYTWRETHGLVHNMGNGRESCWQLKPEQLVV